MRASLAEADTRRRRSHVKERFAVTPAPDKGGRERGSEQRKRERAEALGMKGASL